MLSYQQWDKVKQWVSIYFGLDTLSQCTTKIIVDYVHLTKTELNIWIPFHLIFHTVLSALRLLCDTVAL